jgi:hypothetical protein
MFPGTRSAKEVIFGSLAVLLLPVLAVWWAWDKLRGR